MSITKSKIDYILLSTVIILLVLGILALSSISAFISQKKIGNSFFFLSHQIIYGIIPGIILAIIFSKIPLSFLKKFSLFFLLINLILLAMVFLPPIFPLSGKSDGGATRWLSFGFVSFQPSEFLKITFILYLANWLNSRIKEKEKKKEKEKFHYNQSLFAFLIVISIIGLLLYLQPDISTLGIIVLTAFLMYFVASTPLWHSVLIFILGLISLFIFVKTASYRWERMLVFLKPGTDPLGIGYQIQQALIAIGSGGIFGVGLGMSYQKFDLLPKPMSDTVFAIFAEETGFIGAVILILLFLVFFWRGIKISKKASLKNFISKEKDKFAQFTALGISCWIIIQAFFNIGSMLKLLPLTGVPLPFISYGGSHLIAEMIGVGILLNISKHC